MVDDFEHGPFLGAEEFPGPRGKDERVPGGDGQRAHEKVLVGGQVRRELEGVWKQAWEGRFVVSLGATKAGITRDVLMMSAMAARGGTQRKGERACLEGGQVAIRLLFDGGA